MIAAEEDMLDGYRDGFDDDRAELPESLSNRGAAYKHGWLNGRDDRVGKPRDVASVLRRRAYMALQEGAR